MLNVPSYQSSFFVQPLSNVVGWIASLSIDFSSGGGRLTLNIHPDMESAGAMKTPIAQITVGCGEKFGDVTFPPLEQILSDNGEHFQAIQDYLYSKLQTLPQFNGSTIL